MLTTKCHCDNCGDEMQIVNENIQGLIVRSDGGFRVEYCNSPISYMTSLPTKHFCGLLCFEKSMLFFVDRIRNKILA